MPIFGATLVKLVDASGDASGDAYSAGTPENGSGVITGAAPFILINGGENAYTSSWAAVPASANATTF